MRKSLVLTISLLMASILLLVGCSSKPTASVEEKEYQYYTAEQTKEAIESNKDMILLDIQVEEEYNAHHIVGTIPTYAYPAKTAEEKAKLDVALPELNASEDPIIVVCPGGGGGAKNSINYLIEKGIDADRLFILENGQKGWTYTELLEK